MTRVLEGVRVGDKVVVTRSKQEQYTLKLVKVRSVEVVTRVFKRVLQTKNLSGIEIETGRGGWDCSASVWVSPLLPGQEAEIEAENAARKIAEAEAVEALRIKRERDHRCRELSNGIRHHLNFRVPEDVLQRALDVLTGKDGA